MLEKLFQPLGNCGRLCAIGDVMSHEVGIMSVGASGRIVIEIEPGLKQELHTALRKEGLHLKAWFLDNAQRFLSEREQLRLALDSQDTTSGSDDEI